MVVLALSFATVQAQPANQGQSLTQGFTRRSIPKGRGISLRPEPRHRPDLIPATATSECALASTIKIAVMIEAFARVAEGRAKWTDELVLTKAARYAGSGILPELGDGLRLTLRDCVRLMMTLSDNTATNMVARLSDYGRRQRAHGITWIQTDTDHASGGWRW